jgi:hypothetical protein
MAVTARPDTTTLDLPLKPSRWPCIVRHLSVAAMFLYVLELQLRGHWIVAMVLAVLALFTWRPAHAEGWTRFSLTADGSLFLARSDGVPHRMELRPQSLRLGRRLLLVLHGKGSTQWLLLGPDNMPAHQLAALRRRLPSPRGSTD